MNVIISGQYSTAQIADIFGLHPNTIRLYEKWGVISMPLRKANGYRIFTQEHISQIEIVRIALRAEVLQNGLRKHAITIIKTVACRDYGHALMLSEKYMSMIDLEIALAEKAINTVRNMLNNQPIIEDECELTRQQAAEELHITSDTLRNWELNELINVKRKKNGYRIYNYGDMQILRIIRELRVANYSLSSILRMLNKLQSDKYANIDKLLNEPDEGEFIVSVCDKLLISLRELRQDAITINSKIQNIKF